jgi:hypothetical protein
MHGGSPIVRIRQRRQGMCPSTPRPAPAPVRAVSRALVRAADGGTRVRQGGSANAPAQSRG